MILFARVSAPAFTVGLVLALLLGFSPLKASAADVGSPAPDFRIEDVSGQVLTLEDFRGKHSLIMIFYHSHG